MRGQGIRIPLGKVVIRAVFICPSCSDINEVRKHEHKAHGDFLRAHCWGCGYGTLLPYDDEREGGKP